MERTSRVWPIAIVLLIIGIADVSHFSPRVRLVEAMGLSGGGFAWGMGFMLVASRLRKRLER